MEFGVRDWMIIIGVLLIVAVLLDGFRRMRQERRGKIRMSLNKQFMNSSDDLEDDEPPSCELPNGGGRVVGRHSGFNKSDGQLDLDQSVPLLMDVDEREELSDDLFDYEVESFSAHDEHDAIDDELEPLSADPEEQPATAASKTSTPKTTASNTEKAEAQSKQTATSPQKPATKATAKTHSSASQPSADNTAAKPASDPEEVLIINVAAKGEPFKGPDLLHILLACDLRFGNMNIFHRYEKSGGKGAVQFSMANSVEPGTFNLEKIDNFTTPGVCFFMSVPGPEQPIKAFECMVETAQCLVTNLNGELLDDSRSAMTNQTLEHCRQRLQEFERRQLTHV